MANKVREPKVVPFVAPLPGTGDIEVRMHVGFAISTPSMEALEALHKKPTFQRLVAEVGNSHEEFPRVAKGIKDGVSEFEVIARFRTLLVDAGFRCGEIECLPRHEWVEKVRV